MTHPGEINTCPADLSGLFDFLKRDQWSKWSYGQRDDYYKQKLKDGCKAILANQYTKSLDQYMQDAIIGSGIYSKSWSRFQEQSPSTFGNIYDAQNELVLAQNIITTAKVNAAQATDKLNSASAWSFVDKSQVQTIIQGYADQQAAAAQAAQAAQNPTTSSTQAAIPSVSQITNWVQANPLLAAGIGVGGYLLFKNKKKKS